MTLRWTAVVICLIVSCNSETWGLGEGVNPGDDPAWYMDVQEAVDVWGSAISVECGVLAFVVGEGHSVKNIPRDEWTHGGDVGGIFLGDGIEVRGDLVAGRQNILLHEFGHAIGLGHVSVEEDPDSVMHPEANHLLIWPSAGDVANVVKAHGCR